MDGWGLGMDVVEITDEHSELLNDIYSYTSIDLEGVDPQGRQTQSAHPARFSPEDKNSKYRIIVKKRFVWEWRRKWRQYIRNRRPPSRLTYQELTKKYTRVSFVLFVIGWHVIGFVVWRKVEKWKKDNPKEKVVLSEIPKKGFIELAEEEKGSIDFEDDN
uniref:Nucleolar protein 10 n=1 Tax=Elaeophora elaphi TaxID=1147741 RepID=A0A0R3RZ97_9BILA